MASWPFSLNFISLYVHSLFIINVDQIIANLMKFIQFLKLGGNEGLRTDI